MWNTDNWIWMVLQIRLHDISINEKRLSSESYCYKSDKVCRALRETFGNVEVSMWNRYFRFGAYRSLLQIWFRQEVKRSMCRKFRSVESCWVKGIGDESAKRVESKIRTRYPHSKERKRARKNMSIRLFWIQSLMYFSRKVSILCDSKRG